MEATEKTRTDWQRTTATTAWPRSEPCRRDLPTWNLTLWSSRHGPDVSAGTWEAEEAEEAQQGSTHTPADGDL